MSIKETNSTNLSQPEAEAELEYQIESDRRMELPSIGTEILDGNLPSEINFQNKSKGNAKHKLNGKGSYNPEEIGIENLGKNCPSGIVKLQQFNIRGKGLFELETKYRSGDAIPITSKTIKFQVKSFSDKPPSNALSTLWSSIVGYSKKQLIIQDGQFYITNLITSNNISSNILQSVYKLTNLLKLFIDPQQNKIRLVFKDDSFASSNLGQKSSKNSSSLSPRRRINKDYEIQDLGPLVEKILLQCNVIGLEVVGDQWE